MATERMRTRRGQGLAVVLVVASAWPWLCAAGEKPAPPPQPDLDLEPPKAVVEEKPFVFEPGGRRDPFTFRRKPAGPEIGGTSKPPGEGQETIAPPQETLLDAATVDRMIAEAGEFYASAEKAFLDTTREGRALDAVIKCDEGLKVFRGVGSLAKYRGLLEARGKLLDLRRAADRLRQRQDAEKKFLELNLRLTGIIARERKSMAIVNGQTVGKGDAVAVGKGDTASSRENLDVVVDDIQRDQVIFVFQGYKMMLTLSDMPRGR